jgi:hypothetical protein
MPSRIARVMLAKSDMALLSCQAESPSRSNDETSALATPVSRWQ